MQHNEVYMSLEVSNYEIRSVVAEYIDMKINVLASCEKTLPVEQGDLSYDEVKKVIIEIRREIVSLLGYDIKNVVLLLSSRNMYKYNDKVRVDTRSIDGVIKKDDIAEGINLLIKKNDNKKYMVSDVVVNKYAAYGYGYVSNPVGLETRYIELEATVYSVPSAYAYPLIKLVEDAGFSIADVCVDTIALAAEAVGVASLKDGAVIVDLSHETTTISYFKNNKTIAHKTVDVGYRHIINDIALCSQIDLDKAMNFTKKYVNLNMKKNSDLTVYRYYDEYNDKQVEINQSFLSDVALSRVEELFSLIEQEIKKYNLGEEELVYICGEGNKIVGLEHYIDNLFKYPAKIYYPKSLGARDSGFTKCLGAIINQAKVSRIKGEILLFVNQAEYNHAISLVEKNNLLYNMDNSENKSLVNRLVSYIFNN